MEKPVMGFDVNQIFNNELLPAQTDRVLERVWLIEAQAKTIPLAFNEVSKLYHAMDEVTTTSDWFVQEGLLHQVLCMDTSWFQVSEVPVFVEFTSAQQSKIGQNIRGFLVNIGDVLLINSTQGVTIPPQIQEFKNKISMLLTMEKNDPDSHRTFTLKDEESGKILHLKAGQLNKILNGAAAKLGGFDKLVVNEQVDWMTICSITNTVF